MPTGYTHDIKDGISFKTFALNCARAFGACITLRDEPSGGDRIPERFEPSDYHATELEQARAELAALDTMTPAELERAAAKAYDDAETSRVIQLKEITDQRAAYEAMLVKVRGWVPPTDDHIGLRDFMYSQITASINADCCTAYYDTPTEPMTGEEWAAKRRASLTHNIEYHSIKHAEEVARAESRTAWVAALKASLP